MIYKGDKKGTLYHGDMHPASLYIGDKKIDGFNKEILKGQGQINWNSKYKASLPNVKISGKVEQETLRGVNMWTTDATFPLNNRPGTSYNEKTQTYTISTDYNINQGGISRSIYHFDKPIPVGTKVSLQLFCLSGKVTGTLSFGGYHFIQGNPRSWQCHVTLPNNQDLTGKVLTNTFITTEEVTDLWFFLYQGLEVLQDVNFKVQYELGEPTPYEPYCGGTPAPNPYYQIAPKFLENSKLECRGNNYFDKEINVPILRAIPEGVKDEIDFSTGTIIRRVQELVLDENDNYLGFTPRPNEPDMTNQIFWAVPGYKHDRYRICCVSNIARGGVIDDRSKKSSIAFTWGQGLAINLPKSFMLCQQAAKNGEWKQFLIDQKAKGTPIIIWYELETPIIEHFNPEIIKQHPGYTELNQIDGISNIEATVYRG